MAPPITAPVALFPTPSALKFAMDGKLQAGITAALAEYAAARSAAAPFSLAIIDLASGASSGTLKYGAFKEDEEHYVASAVKVAAMYAAFALRDLVRRYIMMATLVSGAGSFAEAARAAVAEAVAAGRGRGAATSGKTPPLFDQLRKLLDPAIEAGSSPLLAATTQRWHRVPHYEQVFTVPRTGYTGPAEFRGEFLTAMRQMIVPSSNSGAGQVIRAVGYGYLNEVMSAAGLFDVPAGKGVWLAGDFVGQYPYARIGSANDGAVAQAGTALSMGKMMALILNEAVLDSASCRSMKALLEDSVTGVDTPFLTRDGISEKLRIPLEKVTHCKLGFGPLKKGGEVCSEILRIEGLYSASKAYAVAYQNVPNTFANLSDVAFMIRRAINIYET